MTSVGPLDYINKLPEGVHMLESIKVNFNTDTYCSWMRYGHVKIKLRYLHELITHTFHRYVCWEEDGDAV